MKRLYVSEKRKKNQSMRKKVTYERERRNGLRQ